MVRVKETAKNRSPRSRAAQSAQKMVERLVERPTSFCWHKKALVVLASGGQAPRLDQGSARSVTGSLEVTRLPCTASGA